MPYFFFLYRTPSSSSCMVFDTISCNMDAIFSINPSANMFVFGVMSIKGAGLPILVEVIHPVSSVIVILSQATLIRWLTFLLGSQTVILTVLLFWIDLFLLTLVFFYSGFLSIEKCCCFSFHWLSIIFTTRSPFHHIAYGYSWADWDGLRDHLRDVPWEGNFKLSASAAASEFCEWVQVGIDVYIPHRKYQVKPHHLHGFQLLVLLP